MDNDGVKRWAPVEQVKRAAMVGAIVRREKDIVDRLSGEGVPALGISKLGKSAATEVFKDALGFVLMWYERQVEFELNGNNAEKRRVERLQQILGHWRETTASSSDENLNVARTLVEAENS